MNNINGLTRKDLIKIYRSKVKNGQVVGRDLLLAYAFLREVPYAKLERIINEDKFPNDGALTFIKYSLSAWVSMNIIRTVYGKSKYDVYKEFREAENVLKNPPTVLKKFKTMFVDKEKHYEEIQKKKQEFTDTVTQIESSVHEWMKEKYKKEEVKAKVA